MVSEFGLVGDQGRIEVWLRVAPVAEGNHHSLGVGVGVGVGVGRLVVEVGVLFVVFFFVRRLGVCLSYLWVGGLGGGVWGG